MQLKSTTGPSTRGSAAGWTTRPGHGFHAGGQLLSIGAGWVMAAVAPAAGDGAGGPDASTSEGSLVRPGSGQDVVGGTISAWGHRAEQAGHAGRPGVDAHCWGGGHARVGGQAAVDDGPAPGDAVEVVEIDVVGDAPRPSGQQEDLAGGGVQGADRAERAAAGGPEWWAPVM